MSYRRGIIGDTASLVRGTEKYDAKGAVVDLLISNFLLCYYECLSLVVRMYGRLLYVENTCLITNPPNECPMKIRGRLASWAQQLAPSKALNTNTLSSKILKVFGTLQEQRILQNTEPQLTKLLSLFSSSAPNNPLA